jgi:hypothetical protein
MKYLSNYKLSTNQVAAAVLTNIAFNTKLLDINNQYSTTSLTFTVPTKAIYTVHAKIMFQTSANTADVTIQLYTLSGVVYTPTGSTSFMQTVSKNTYYFILYETTQLYDVGTQLILRCLISTGTMTIHSHSEITYRYLGWL